MGRDGSRIKYLVVFLCLTLVLLACGGSGGDEVGTTEAGTEGTTASEDTVAEPESSDDNLADVPGCNLVTDDEISAVTGSPVSSKDEIGVQGCAWQTENGGEVSFIRYAGDYFSSDTCDGQVFFISGDEEEISGLGDYAIWGSSGTLVVCRSDVVLKIDIDYSPNTTIEQDRDSAVGMARTLLAQDD